MKMKIKKRSVLIGLALFLWIAAACLATWIYFPLGEEVTDSDFENSSVEEVAETPSRFNLFSRFIAVEPPELPAVISPFTGRELPPETTFSPLAVMIENHTASRPQMQGLSQADVVYETLAEGGITRFMAIFSQPSLPKIGPVRSARPYFVDWAQEWATGYAHAGGSEAALEQVYASELIDFDEDISTDLLFRDFAHEKPHNLFADLGLISAELPTVKADEITPHFQFGDVETAWPVDAPVASTITLDFSFPNYRAEFVYDELSGDYRRRLAGITHLDALGNQIRPKNVVVQFTEYWVIDDALRLKLRTDGVGTAWYFTAGKFQAGTWQKLPGGQTRFLDAAGQEIVLTPGQTFVEVIAADRASWQ